MPRVHAKDRGFLDDGGRRYVEALDSRIRSEVEAEFADSLRHASWGRRFLVRRRIEREIRRRLRDQVRPDLLY